VAVNSHSAIKSRRNYEDYRFWPLKIINSGKNTPATEIAFIALTYSRELPGVFLYILLIEKDFRIRPLNIIFKNKPILFIF
jgi:hypothetical protein